MALQTSQRMFLLAKITCKVVIVKRPAMKKFQKLIVLFIFLLLVINIGISDVKATGNVISLDEVPNGNKTIRLKLNNKPLSYALKRVATKAGFSLIISPDFQDGTVSVNLKSAEVKNVLKTLMQVSNFSLIQDDSSIIVTSEIKPEISSDIVLLENSNAEHVAYTLAKTSTKDDNDSINYDSITNSIIIQGDKDFINATKNFIVKMDSPKKHSTFKLNNYTSAQIKNLLDNMVFNTQQNPPSEIDNKNILSPVFDEELGYVIKCMVEKNENLELKADRPLIISEDSNEITIIGNSYQVALTKELIEYLEGKKIDKDEEIRLSQGKLQESKKELEETRKELKETQLQLSDAILDQVEKDIELKETKKQVEQLKTELNQLKSEKLWDYVLNATPDNNVDQLNSLQSEILHLREEIAQNKLKLSEKDKLNGELEQKLLEKEEQLEQTNNHLKEIKAQLAEQKISRSLNASHNVSGQNVQLLSASLDELNNTKTELNKVRKQLDVSKKQLELIFGGKLLDPKTVPNDKSRWFK